METVFIVFKVYGCTPLAAFKSRSEAESQAKLMHDNENTEFVVRSCAMIWDFEHCQFFATASEAHNAETSSS